jgi:hypothetical protein
MQHMQIITHRYKALMLRTPTLGHSTAAATQGNEQVASGCTKKDHIQMLGSWNQLNLLVTT